MAYAKAEGATTNKLLEIKNNSLLLLEPEYVQTFDIFVNIEDNLKEFHKHYQQLASTRKEQKQHLKEINIQLCDYCLIPYDFKYCNECNLIYNPPPCMIYTIPEEDKPISNCASESESIFNPNSNSDNNDNENTDSSSAQNSNKNNNDSDPNSNSKTYITFPDLTKEQELKWFSKNNKEEEIINAGYIGNIIAMLQNDSEKTYTIDPNEKIAQAIFLPLVKVA
ncbi:hypothetical protein G9A89_021588 [Geosiphon pyriformis]|nr:hypothetical protein G9A89_021588 [Geosiphon pyriformis]